MSGSQTLTIVALLCCLDGIGMLGFAFYAFQRHAEIRRKIEAAVADTTAAVTESLKEPLASPPTPPAGSGAAGQETGMMPAADYVRALGDLAEKLAKLSPPIAALLVSTILFFLAATLGSIEFLHH